MTTHGPWLPRPFERSTAERYGFAVAAVAVTMLLRESLQVAVGAKTPFYLLLMLAPIAAAWYGGRRPGWLATALGAAFGYVSLIQPVTTQSFAEQTVYVTAFVAVGTLVSGIIDAYARTLAMVEQEKAEILARERRAHEVLEAAPSAMLLLGPDGRIALANGEAERLFGHSREALVRLTPEDLIPRRLRDGHAVERSAFQREPSSRPMGAGRDLYALRADGTEVPVEIGLRTFTTDAGPHVLATVVDISARRSLERARDRQAELVDVSSDAIFVRQFEGPVTFWSRGAERLYGWTAAEAIGRVPHELLGGPSAELRETIWRELRAHGEWSGEFRHVRKDGTAVTVLSRWKLANAAGDAPPEVLETNTDVSDIVAAREAMRFATERLQDVDRRKDEFLAVLAHELRNPLSPMRSGLALLERSADPASHARARAMMQRQLAQLVRLVDDLLDVSRISTGKLRLTRERLALAGAIERAVEGVQPQVDARRQRLTVTPPPTPIFLMGDDVRITQVLTNLLNNASKYTDPGGAIHVRVQPPARGRVRIDVSDTGVGLAPEALERVFELFTQEPRHGRPREGLGIGLSLARQLVAMHGGTLSASSDGEGRGSTFTVELPVAVALVEPATARKDVARPGAHRIVVADDNRDAADSLATLLSLGGHEVHVVYDGTQALAAVLEHAPDVAILDIGMPGLTGYEVAEQLRRTPAGRRCVLLALTGWGQDSDRARAAAAGFDRHFTKPVDPDALERLLSELERSGRLTA